MPTIIPISGNRCAAPVLLAVALLCFAMLASPPAGAADEDTQASVYLVFDPETGEFVTVHDADGAAQAQETQEAIDSVADVAGSNSSPAADGGSEAATGPGLIAALVFAALVVIGGAVLYQRSRRSA